MSDWLSPAPGVRFHLREMSRAMHHGKNLHGSFSLPVDNAVALDKQFPDFGVRRFWHAAATVRKCLKLIDGEDQPFDDRIGIFGGVSGDIVLDVFEIGNGRFSPLDAGHFLRKRFFTAVWDTTCPSSAAVIPASIFFRT